MENVNVTHPGNVVNDAKVKKVRASSKFDEKYCLAHGQRFGQLYAPFFFDAVAKDKVVLRSAHNVRSYTLKSPLLSDLSLKKDYFQVTRRAILPLNWEKFFDNPPLGDDVTSDVGTTVVNFSERIKDIIYNGPIAYAYDEGESETAVGEWLNACLIQLVVMSYFYSYGSLLAASGFSMERFCKLSGYKNFDAYFDAVISAFEDDLVNEGGSPLYISFTYASGEQGRVYSSSVFNSVDSSGSYDVISVRRLFELLHDDPSSIILDFSDLQTNLSDTITVIRKGFGGAADWKGSLDFSEGDKCDLARLFAYQMVVCHYYTNDSIDFVYSADLYRQTVGAAWDDLYSKFGADASSIFLPSFSYNGVKCLYDNCAAKQFDIYNVLINDPATPQTYAEYMMWVRPLSLIFAWRQSLRFTDYFTGAKTRPLAVGDVDVAVNTGNNTVNIIDITKNIQRQRFFNAVNRTGRKIEQYLEGIFGAKPSHDWHNPLWLGHTKDTIIADEVQNNAFNPSEGTENAEQLVSASLRGASNRYAFEVQVDEPSILVGISYFDIPRFYIHATERIMMHEDRFDMFNPFMQFIGDQPIFLRELTDGIDPRSGQVPSMVRGSEDYFGYTMRNMEYKQRFSRAVGPFATGVLPSWIFIDSQNGRGDYRFINPDYIRSSCVELDPYYTSISYYSLANYFHFIVLDYNECGAIRNMVFAPNIL